MAKTLGIKFPFADNSGDGILIDLNKTTAEEVKSNLMLLLLTPIGSRYRNRSFGSNFIKYIFEPNDDTSIGDIKYDLNETIKRYFSNLTIEDIVVTQSEDEREISVRVDYTIMNGIFQTNDYAILIL